jgi:integrase
MFADILRTWGGMGQKLTDSVVKALQAPDTGFRITYDADLKGFGIRVTAAGARAYVLNYRTRAGRERRYTIGSFPDWKTSAARAEAAELKKLIDRGGDPLGDVQEERSAPTVAKMCDQFITEHLPRKRATTHATYLRQINKEIRPALGKLKVGEVTFAMINSFHRSISMRAPYQANRTLALLSRMFSLAIRWGMRTDNPCRGVERNQEQKRRRYLTSEEIARLTTALAEYPDQQGADIVRLLLLTGARLGEVLNMRWADVEIVSGTWSKPGATTKQKTAHHVPLSDAARQLLTALRGQQRDDAVWVFPAGAGHRKSIRAVWKGLCKAANIEGARLHDLRHTYASVLASAGLSLPIIGALLGHSTPTTTARYAHLLDDPLRAATERASAIISGR